MRPLIAAIPSYNSYLALRPLGPLTDCARRIAFHGVPRSHGSLQPAWEALSIRRRQIHQSTRPDLPEPTIYALSTGSGKAAIATIRISGPAWRQVYQGLCPSKPVPRARYAAFRRLYSPHEPPSPATLLDSGALVLYFPGPSTVTGEDVLELHVHGGPAIVRAVLAAIPRCVHSAPVSTVGKHAQIRYAEPGEFTRRAFANGRMDLPQIESLGETLSATTEQQRQVSVRGTTSSLAVKYEHWRTLLLQARGELEALIDFSEDQHFDDSPAALCASVAKLAEELASQIRAHIANAVRGELLRNGISVALLGAPNAGKSSLLNRIVGREAAIVSHEAGTTRDIVEVVVDLGGWLVRLGDMAGLRKAGLVDAAAVGAVEQEGIRRAKARALESDVLVVVQDATAEMDPEVMETARRCIELGIGVIVAVNKTDKAPVWEVSLDQWRAKTQSILPIPSEHIFCISCKDFEDTAPLHGRSEDPGQIQEFLRGLLRIFERMTTAIIPDADPNPTAWQESLGATERQRVLLSECISHLQAFLAAVSSSADETSSSVSTDHESDEVDIVIAAESLRSAADTLARITGRGESGDVEEVLGVVFEK